MEHDGTGLFATGLLFMFITYKIWQFFFDNILICILGMIAFGIIFALYTAYGSKHVTKFKNIVTEKIRNLLYRVFKVDLYNNQPLWYSYCTIVGILHLGLDFLLILLGIRLACYIL